MILNREHQFGGAIAGFAKRFLQAGYLRRLALREELYGRHDQNQANGLAGELLHCPLSCATGLRMASAMAAARSREMCR